MDKTALSYWFPKVRDADVPVPETVILDMPPAAMESIIAAFDGQEAGDPQPFFDQIHEAANRVGYPCFLRTDHTSGKHDWKDTCFLPDRESIPRNLFAIVEYSEMAGFPGLPWDRWAVREFLPTKPMGVCRRYGDMPLCREFRFFVRGGDVVCKHPYWPMEAIEQGEAEFSEGFDYEALCALSPEDDTALTAIASEAGTVLGGGWSVDLLETERGWFLTDMAEAHKSWHWPGCPLSDRE